MANINFNKTYNSSPSSSKDKKYLSDAWGRSKQVFDNSILHGMFTYNVPVSKWRELHNGVEQSSFSAATSVDGMLRLTSTSTFNEKRSLLTFRNPRYQPNRGHLYSSSIFLPDKNLSGIRRFGYFTSESGAFFELTNTGLYAVTRSTVSGITTDNRVLVPSDDFDVEKGNVFDIQMQWRGVGNYTFYINLKPVYTFEYLGTLDNLSTYNPANPISFESINDGDEVLIYCGCVDVSSEGGDNMGGTYGSIGVPNSSGQVSITGENIPIIAIRSKLQVDGKINTRDTLALLASAYGDQRAMLRVWVTRDFSAINEEQQSWSDFGDGHLEYIVQDEPDVSTPMSFDTLKAQLVFTSRVNQDETYATSALFEGRTDVYLTPGDMFVFTMHRETGAGMNAGVTFEFSEEI